MERRSLLKLMFAAPLAPVTVAEAARRVIEKERARQAFMDAIDHAYQMLIEYFEEFKRDVAGAKLWVSDDQEGIA